jgi:hypothetical protein
VGWASIMLLALSLFFSFPFSWLGMDRLAHLMHA